MTDLSKLAQVLTAQYNKVSYSFTQQREAVVWLRDLVRILFPQSPPQKRIPESQLQGHLEKSFSKLSEMLNELSIPKATEVAEKFYDSLSPLKDLMLTDLEAIFQGDPAAKSQEEIVMTYPGFTAITVHRIAHFFYEERVHLLPRIFSEYVHQITGIDIHPGASIGKSFCIDHGTGIVVGETTNIGERVKLYQGVTLGALSVKKNLSDTKRHPTVENDVVIYASTTILGGETIIGHNSIIGGNVWLTESVPPHSKVYRKFELEVKTK